MHFKYFPTDHIEIEPIPSPSLIYFINKYITLIYCKNKYW